MNKAITISTTISTTYMVEGTIIDKKTKKGVVDLRVLVYDEDPGLDDFLGIAVTNENGVFQLSFDASQFRFFKVFDSCLLYTSPSPRDGRISRMPSSA